MRRVRLFRPWSQNRHGFNAKRIPPVSANFVSSAVASLSESLLTGTASMVSTGAATLTSIAAFSSVAAAVTGGTATLTDTAWTPTTKSGLSLWLRSDLGVTTSSGNLTQWADQSGNGLHATPQTGSGHVTVSATGGPNSVPALVFPGTIEIGNTGTVTTSTNLTIVYIQKVTAVTPAQSLGSIGVANTNGLSMWVDLLGHSERAINVAGVANEADANNSASTSYEVWVVQQTNTGPSTTLRVNGSARTLGGSATMNAPGAGYTIGAQNSSGSSRMTGDFVEVLVYNSLMSASDLLGLSSYTNSRYGLAA